MEGGSRKHGVEQFETPQGGGKIREHEHATINLNSQDDPAEANNPMLHHLPVAPLCQLLKQV